MLTNANFRKFEESFRRRYILSKQSSIKNIVSAYAGSLKYVGEALQNSKYPLSARYSKLILADLNRAISETTPSLSRTFSNEMQNMASLGVDNFRTPLEVNGKTNPGYMQKTDKIPGETVAQEMWTKSELASVPLSQNIWNVDKRADVLKLVQEGIQNQKSPFEISDDLQNYSMTGKGYYNAFRLAYTEMTWSFIHAKLRAIMEWNNDSQADFQVGVYQYLSPFHYKYDVCDILEGYYKAEYAPTIPRHPNCECGQRPVILDKEIRRQLTTIQKQFKKIVDKLPPEQKSGLKKQTQQVEKYQKSGINSNDELNRITQTYKGEELTQKLQEFVNNLPKTDALYKSITNTVQSIYGIKPQISGTLNPDKLKFITDNKIQTTDFENKILKDRDISISTFDYNEKIKEFSHYGRYTDEKRTIQIANQAPDILASFFHEIGHLIDYRAGSRRFTDTPEYYQLLTQKELNNIVANRIKRYDLDVVVGKEPSLTDAEYILLARGKFVKNDKLKFIIAPLGNYKYMRSAKEVFAEAYSQYRNKPFFKNYAPNFYKYFKEKGY